MKLTGSIDSNCSFALPRTPIGQCKSGFRRWKARHGWQVERKPDDARTLLRRAAEEEDTIEKLPVTPGPIIPAREQLGDLLLAQNEPKLATEEFQRALTNAPKRLAALNGLSRATELVTRGERSQ